MNPIAEQKFSFFTHPEGKAIALSLGVGFIILLLKIGAYLFTGSKSFMADMLESIVHNFAVAFAAYCLRLSYHPPDDNHLYGHGKVQFFSSGVEGGLVTGAGIMIIINSLYSWITGYTFHAAEAGLLLAIGAGVINTLLAVFLIYTGKRRNSIIVTANGYHVLSDVYTTSIGLLGFLITQWTGNLIYDVGIAVLAGFWIIQEGFKLLRSSLAGLMDEVDETVDRKIREILERQSIVQNWDYHALRHRSEGNKIWVELHLMFDEGISLEKAHHQATDLESLIRTEFNEPVYITTHLEPKTHEHPDHVPHSHLPDYL
ncbi:MAG: cation diffusion facilitator family transporter [bacterium]|jgi:cation diffusion facilitator family transporter